ncbi:MAG TPA: 2-isopropylmalate synthase [Actinocrinis sp.]
MQANLRHRRYSPFVTFELPDRAWPGRRQQEAPRWLSTDLRDGNQALAVPMDPQRKLAMFELLVQRGYKEIEVGFPVASRDEHDFVRMLIEQDRIPDDVRISVLVPAREELIRRSVESLRGAHAATLHLYNATCPTFRSVVFGMDRAECKALAVDGTRAVVKYAEQELAGTDFGFQYSPELFNETEPDFALEVCEAVMDVWQPEAGRQIVLNFPATVERSTPNVFADQIEWLDRNLTRREHVCLSVHPHNDRGTGVAAAELAVLAGAQRVEGCLFGGGERAGNVCLVTLGLNLYSQGIDPQVDFSDINRMRATVEECTGMKVHERHPYAGDLVYTAFSGSHQDAINKGFDAARREAHRAGAQPRDLPWQVPYLPIDPEDLGRGYEEVVRITSQSGKGGIAYIMTSWHGLRLPRGMQADFAGAVQRLAETAGELTPERIRRCFESEYLATEAEGTPFTIAKEPLVVELYLDGIEDGEGGRHTDALRTLGTTLEPWGIEVRDVHRTATVGDGAPCDVVKAYAAASIDGEVVWGAGVDADLHTAAFSAVRAAAVRAGALVPPAVAIPTGPVPDLLLARAAHPGRTAYSGHETYSDNQAQRIQTGAHRSAHGKAANGAAAASGAKSSPLSTLTAGHGRPAD